MIEPWSKNKTRIRMNAGVRLIPVVRKKNWGTLDSLPRTVKRSEIASVRKKC